MGPRILIIRLLEACNAGCFMCDFARSSSSYRFGAARARALAEMIRGGTFRVVRFTGGEPLLCEDLPEILLSFRESGLATSVITNGWHLADRTEELASAGLSHVIVSLDGTERTHDRARATPGLFGRLTTGLYALKAKGGIRLRVNTVVGPHNVDELSQVWGLLRDIGVHEWSIIPLKRSAGAWRGMTVDRMEASMEALRTLESAGGGPRLLGFSAYWAGRTPEERARLARGESTFTPRGECKLVDQVRYYVPQEGLVFPCNCVPHRVSGRQLGLPDEADALLPDGIAGARNWLREHGPSHCTGCEPINAALGEGQIDLDEDPLGF